MAFEGLTEKLNAAFKKLRGKGRLTENDVREAMREVRLALLEADVGYKVVKEFVATVTERAIGSDVLESLTPAQQVIKIVNEELTNLMGGGTAKIAMANNGPTVVMMVGLQGAGKTTTTAKLAGLFRRQMGKRPLLAACDVYRPAAIEQLKVVGGWSYRSSSRVREIPWPSPRRLFAMPGITATTWYFWTPPAASMWMKR